MTDTAITTATDAPLVVVPTDFSETARLAMQRAAEVAARQDAKLLLVHALNPQLIAIGMPAHVVVPPAMDEKIREVTQDRLQRLAEELRREAPGVEVETRLIVGEPGRAVLDLADETGCGLIVLGTRGLSGFEHLVLGSTAEMVVRRARCPVLTVTPGAAGPSPASAGGVLRVLVPCELTENPEPAARELIRLLAVPPSAVRILLVYSDHLPAYLQPLIEDLGIDKVGFEEVAPELKERLGSAAAALRALGCEVDVEIAEGEPSAVIVETARRHAVDLIAMETHGRKGLAHLFLRSTAERVVRHAACPVLTVHRAAS
jgi:nucleotide-binding universal stress UspA family protein